MKIKLLVSRSGPDGAFSVGDVIDVSTDEAKRMFEADQAIPFREDAAVETATKRKAKKA